MAITSANKKLATLSALGNSRVVVPASCVKSSVDSVAYVVVDSLPAILGDGFDFGHVDPASLQGGYLTTLSNGRQVLAFNSGSKAISYAYYTGCTNNDKVKSVTFTLKMDDSSSSGIASPHFCKTILARSYYDLNGRRLGSDCNVTSGVVVEVTTYTDGTRSSAKRIMH